jgi:hypothetical protein
MMKKIAAVCAAALVVSVVSAPAASAEETLTITVIGGVTVGASTKAQAKKEAQKINKKRNHKKYDCVEYGLSPYGYETDVDTFDRVKVTDESGTTVGLGRFDTWKTRGKVIDRGPGVDPDIRYNVVCDLIAKFEVGNAKFYEVEINGATMEYSRSELKKKKWKIILT